MDRDGAVGARAMDVPNETAKYNSNAAAAYRDRIVAVAEGRQWTDPPVVKETPGSGPPAPTRKPPLPAGLGGGGGGWDDWDDDFRPDMRRNQSVGSFGASGEESGKQPPRSKSTQDMYTRQQLEASAPAQRHRLIGTALLPRAMSCRSSPRTSRMIRLKNLSSNYVVRKLLRERTTVAPQIFTLRREMLLAMASSCWIPNSMSKDDTADAPPSADRRHAPSIPCPSRCRCPTIVPLFMGNLMGQHYYK